MPHMDVSFQRAERNQPRQAGEPVPVRAHLDHQGPALHRLPEEGLGRPRPRRPHDLARLAANHVQPQDGAAAVRQLLPEEGKSVRAYTMTGSRALL